MYRIRFHGRGGQGIKTASRILGNAFFLSGFEVQDAPRYGAERRGAPIFAYVRAARDRIHERGIIVHPDLVLVADETLVGVAAAGVTDGLDARAFLVIVGETNAETWQERLRTEAHIVVLPPETVEPGEFTHAAAACAGAAARMVGVIEPDALRRAVDSELAPLGRDVVAENETCALAAYKRVEALSGCLEPSAEARAEAPRWVTLHDERAERAAPAIYALANSVRIRTGLWRTMRPVHRPERCNKCVWICGSFCPDGVISTGVDGFPEIDLDHCKGCLVCVAQCPHHAFDAVPETEAAAEAKENAQ